MEGRRPFHDLSAGETAAPDLSGECGGGKTPPQISRRKDPAYDRRESLGTEEKTSRTRDIHSEAFTPGLTPGVLCRFLIDPSPSYQQGKNSDGGAWAADMAIKV